MARLMYGRNGMDQLNMALLVLYVAVCVARAIVLGRSPAADTVFDVVLLAMAVLILWRMFSRNLYRRRAENQKWMGWWTRARRARNDARARHADTAHRYFTCKTCKTICRVPAGKGKIIITCPKCGAEIHGRS